MSLRPVSAVKGPGESGPGTRSAQSLLAALSLIAVVAAGLPVVGQMESSRLAARRAGALARLAAPSTGPGTDAQGSSLSGLAAGSHGGAPDTVARLARADPPSGIQAPTGSAAVALLASLAAPAPASAARSGAGREPEPNPAPGS
jgi:hypothetical protein